MTIRKILLGFAVVSIVLGVGSPTTYAVFSREDHESASVDQLYCAAEKSNYDDKQECFQSPEVDEQPQDTESNLLIHIVFIFILLTAIGTVMFILNSKVKHHRGRPSNK